MSNSTAALSFFADLMRGNFDLQIPAATNGAALSSFDRLIDHLRQKSLVHHQVDSKYEKLYLVVLAHTSEAYQVLFSLQATDFALLSSRALLSIYPIKKKSVKHLTSFTYVASTYCAILRGLFRRIWLFELGRLCEDDLGCM